MKVSIIVLTYNDEKCIERTLSSLVNQSYSNLEIIILDGGSTDKTLDIIKKFPVQIFCKENTYIPKARNLGAEYSTGELLFFIDADETIDSNFIEENVKMFQDDNDVAALVIRQKEFYPENPLTKCLEIGRIGIGFKFFSSKRDEIVKVWERYHIRALKREIFDILHGYDDKFYIYEDIDLLLRVEDYCKKKNYKVLRIESPPINHYHYYCKDRSMTSFLKRVLLNEWKGIKGVLKYPRYHFGSIISSTFYFIMAGSLLIFIVQKLTGLTIIPSLILLFPIIIGIFHYVLFVISALTKTRSKYVFIAPIFYYFQRIFLFLSYIYGLLRNLVGKW